MQAHDWSSFGGEGFDAWQVHAAKKEININIFKQQCLGITKAFTMNTKYLGTCVMENLSIKRTNLYYSS